MKLMNTLVQKKATPLFLRYLFPSVIGTLLIAVNYLIDTICVGQSIGETGLAALNVVVPVTGFMYASGYMMAYGSSNLFSNYMGAGKRKEAKEVYGTSLVALLLLSLVTMGLGLWFCREISWFLCSGADFYEKTEEYLWYVFLFTPFYCFETYYSVYIRNDGAPVMSMIGTFTTCTANVVMDILFVWVFDWGMAGASLATGLALALGFLVAFSATCRKGSELKVWKAKVKMRTLPGIAVNGTPDFFREFSGCVVILLVNIILLELSGSTAVAAYGVIANLGNVVLCGLAGTSNAMQPLVSYNYGAGRMDRVHTFRRLALISTVVLAGAYVVYAELYPASLVALFLDEPTPVLSALSEQGIRIISPGYVFAGLSMVYGVYLESLHQPGGSFWISNIRGLIAPIGCIFLFVPWFDVTGVWYSFVAAEIVSLILSIAIVVYHDKKITKKMKEEGDPVEQA